jgi:hypothetical protein
MSLQKTLVIPLANYPTGPLTTPAVSLPDDVSIINITLQRCTSLAPTVWPNSSTTLALSVEQSNNGGTTWVPVAGVMCGGGIRQSEDGGELSEQYIKTAVFPGVSRKFRATAVIGAGPLRTSLSVEAT